MKGKLIMDTMKHKFNKIWMKFYKKDYFELRKEIKNQLLYAKKNNIKVSISQIKNYIKNERNKCFDFIQKRLILMAKGEKIPQREKFSHYCFKYFLSDYRENKINMKG